MEGMDPRHIYICAKLAQDGAEHSSGEWCIPGDEDASVERLFHTAFGCSIIGGFEPKAAARFMMSAAGNRPVDEEAESIIQGCLEEFQEQFPDVQTLLKSMTVESLQGQFSIASPENLELIREELRRRSVSEDGRLLQ